MVGGERRRRDGRKMRLASVQAQMEGRQSERQTGSEGRRQTETDKQGDRLRVKETGSARQTHRQTDRQTERGRVKWGVTKTGINGEGYIGAQASIRDMVSVRSFSHQPVCTDLKFKRTDALHGYTFLFQRPLHAFHSSTHDLSPFPHHEYLSSLSPRFPYTGFGRPFSQIMTTKLRIVSDESNLGFARPFARRAGIRC